MMFLYMMWFIDCNLDCNEEEKYRYVEVVKCFIEEGYDVNC